MRSHVKNWNSVFYVWSTPKHKLSQLLKKGECLWVMIPVDEIAYFVMRLVAHFKDNKIRFLNLKKMTSLETIYLLFSRSVLALYFNFVKSG